jgi:glycosyltransferase involved in cell wall biosynthesis
MAPRPPGYPEISLSLFCPAYYDEKNVDKVVEGALAAVEEMGLRDYEIIIVEDGSPDRTAEVADALAARHERVRVIHHGVNKGYGTALKTGFEAARYEYVFYTDGDNQFNLDELKRLVALCPYADIVAGFRVYKQYTFYRKLTSRIYYLVLKYLFDLPDRDINCAFKLYPTRLFREFTIESKAGFIDAEIALQARMRGYRTLEVGVSHLPRKDGVALGASSSMVVKTIREMLRFHGKHGNRIRTLRRRGRWREAPGAPEEIE